MVIRNVTFDDLSIHRPASLPDQIPQADRYFPIKNRSAVFGYPYHMKFDVTDKVRILAVVPHDTSKLPESSPEGEGFSPIPRWGH